MIQTPLKFKGSFHICYTKKKGCFDHFEEKTEMTTSKRASIVALSLEAYIFIKIHLNAKT